MLVLPLGTHPIAHMINVYMSIHTCQGLCTEPKHRQQWCKVNILIDTKTQIKNARGGQTKKDRGIQ